MVPVLPGDLPDELKARIVDPFDFDSIPILDLSLEYKSPEDKAALLKSLHRATKEIGFMTIVNHGVDYPLIERMCEKSKQFFDLPQGKKEEFKMDGDILSGYFGKG